MTKHFTDENFQTEVLDASNEKLVVVDFFANWCGPCKMQGPIVDEVAEEVGDKIIVGKADVDECKKTAEKYAVSGIPTIIIFKDGEPRDILRGFQSKAGLMSWL